MEQFFITGLPRSRTSWLANLMTHEQSFCYHDGLGIAPSARELAELLREAKRENADLRYVGDSDSALAGLFEEINTLWPKARWAIVRRNFVDAAHSYWQQFRGTAYPHNGSLEETIEVFGRLDQQLDRVCHAVSGRAIIVSYESLELPQIIERVHHHLVPGVWFDRRRAAQLQCYVLNPHPVKATRAWAPKEQLQALADKLAQALPPAAEVAA